MKGPALGKIILARGAGLAAAAALLLCAMGCFSAGKHVEERIAAGSTENKPASEVQVDEQPGTVYYEIFVRSFYDSDGDGIGDLNGVTAKLDYLKGLGVGGIWLMPINPSPSYHGYDVTDYYDVNKEYGTLADLQKLTKEAHKRGINVIMDLVVNHTSKEHPWFKAALADSKSPYRNWYHIEPKDAQVKGDGAVGGDPWHPYGSEKYLGVFWEGMPDLNLDEPAVRSEMIKVGSFWLKQGVDGFRMDAAKHIFGDFASTIQSDAVKAKNQKWWQDFRSGIAGTRKDAYIVGEVWDSPVVIAPYLNHAFDSAFNFDLAQKLLSGADREQNPDVAYTLRRVYDMYGKASDGAFLDAPFLSNHDQNRTMSELDGNVDHAKMAASLLLTLPGNPFIYYGEEIGMKGMKPDEAIREPLPWYKSKDGGQGQTAWEPVRYNTAPERVSVEAEAADPNSLLAHYKKLIAWRSQLPVLRDGATEDFSQDNPAVAAYYRVTNAERMLVVHNLSGKAQTVNLNKEGFDPEHEAAVVRATKDGADLDEGSLKLPPYSTALIQ